jgi:transcriptional regulator with XRE-family HTH domain
MATPKIDPRQPDSTDVEVGRLVRALRMSRGLSQTELANRIGVTFQQVQKYESGANRISILRQQERVAGLGASGASEGKPKRLGVRYRRLSDARSMPRGSVPGVRLQHDNLNFCGGN